MKTLIIIIIMILLDDNNDDRIIIITMMKKKMGIIYFSTSSRDRENEPYTRVICRGRGEDRMRTRPMPLRIAKIIVMKRKRMLIIKYY